jgi:hypothetical protein
MDMIGHQTEIVNSATKFLDGILEIEIKTIPVSIIKKNRMSGITTENYMINRPWKMDSRFTCHGKMLTGKYLKVKPDPSFLYRDVFEERN